MKKHIFIAFLSIALFRGFLFAEINSVPDSNTSQPPISDTYQEEDVLISFNGAYSKTDYYGFYIELNLKILASNKIIRPDTDSYRVMYIKVLDNFGNDLGFVGISPLCQDISTAKGLSPGEEKIFTIKCSNKPLKNTEYLLLKIPEHIFGNVNPFELKIVNFHSIPDSLKKWQQENAQIAVREANERLSAEREAYKKGRLIVIVASVVSPLVVVICITWLLVKVKRIRQFIVSYRTQIIIWIGILLIVLMCLFPPSGYSFLFSEYRSVVIDVVQLGLQCGLVALVIGGLIYTFRGEKRD
jgi:hypothetical protein